MTNCNDVIVEGKYSVSSGALSAGVKVLRLLPSAKTSFRRGQFLALSVAIFVFLMSMRFRNGMEGRLRPVSKPVVYADGVGDLTKVVDQDTDDDISKFMDWLQVYPVMKLSFRGRIL